MMNESRPSRENYTQRTPPPIVNASTLLPLLLLLVLLVDTLACPTPDGTPSVRIDQEVIDREKKQAVSIGNVQI